MSVAEGEYESADEILIDEPLQDEVEETFEPQGVYLCGPIRCVEDNGVGWREELKEDYDGYTFNDPLDRHDPEEITVLNDPSNFNEESEEEQVLPSELVFDDKMMINRSDCLFVGLPGEIARGSCMEMMYAYMRDIPFFVWEMNGQTESNWIYHHAEYVSDDRESVMEELKRYVY